MNVLLITFIGGFILATLIFWPLLRRAHQRARASARNDRPRLVRRAEATTPEPAYGIGKHAAPRTGAPSNAAETSTTDHTPHPVRGRHASTTKQRATAPVSTNANDPTAETHAVPSDSTTATTSTDTGQAQPTKTEFARSIRINGQLPPLSRQHDTQQREIPIMSANLYQRKFAWRFERSHQRLQRVRSEITRWPTPS